MLEVVVFAVVLVLAQLVSGFIIMGLFLNEKFIKYYMKKMAKLMKGLEEDLEEIYYGEDEED